MAAFPSFRISACADHITDRFVLHRRDPYRRKVPYTQQTGQLYGIAAVGLHPVARLLRNLGGSCYPAVEMPLGEGALQPVPARPHLVDKGQLLALCLQLPKWTSNPTKSVLEYAMADPLLGILGRLIND